MNSLSLLLFLTSAWMPQEPSQEDQTKKMSYILGNQFMQSIGEDAIEIDLDSLISGIQDGMEGKSNYSDEEISQAMAWFRTKMTEAMKKKRLLQMEENKKEADAFMSANKEKEGVITLASGLQYKVLNEGQGQKPLLTDRVKVHYRGKLLNGTEFDSSFKYNKPATFQVKGVIPGWIEALQLMAPGSKWEVYIPPQLAYGPSGSGRSVPPNAALIFEIELLEIVGKTPQPADK